jgi:hypothetical protein
LDARLQALSAEQREQLSSGELAEMMPLLHLRAGGGAAQALFALATTPAATHELPLAFDVPSAGADQERQQAVRLAHDLAERAALHFLRDRVLDVSGSAGRDPALLSALQRAARAAGRPDVARLALELWSELEPTPELRLMLGEARALAGDVAGVRAILDQLPESSPQHARLSRLLAAAEGASTSDPIARSWNLLALGRYAEAGAVLAPRAGACLKATCGLAPLSHRRSGGLRLPRFAGGHRLAAALCAGGQGAPRVGASSGRHGACLAGQGGRDAASVEAYLGLAHVVPWVTEMALATDAVALERDFTKRYEALERRETRCQSNAPWQSSPWRFRRASRLA